MGPAEALVGLFASPGDLFRRWARKPNPILAWVWPMLWLGVWWAYLAVRYPAGIHGIAGFTAAALLVTAFLAFEGGFLTFAINSGLAIPFAGGLGFGRAFVRSLGAVCLTPWWPGASILGILLDLVSREAFRHFRSVRDVQSFGALWMLLWFILFVYGVVLFFYAYHRVMATETDGGEYVTDFGRYLLGLLLALVFGSVAFAVSVAFHMALVLGVIANAID